MHNDKNRTVRFMLSLPSFLTFSSCYPYILLHFWCSLLLVDAILFSRCTYAWVEVCHHTAAEVFSQTSQSCPWYMEHSLPSVAPQIMTRYPITQASTVVAIRVFTWVSQHTNLSMQHYTLDEIIRKTLNGMKLTVWWKVYSLSINT